MERIGHVAGAVGLALALASGSAAGIDFLKRGKEILDGIGGGGAGELTSGEIANGLKEALRVGTGNVVGQLGQTGGFERDPSVRIPLPDSLEMVRNTLSKIGMSGKLDDLELRLNRAAEVATPKAKRLFGEAIADMSIDDVKANLTEHVVERGMDGIFHYLAKEEAAIRQNPAKRTTELLQKVFGR